MFKKVADGVIALLLGGIVVTLALEMVPLSRGIILTTTIVVILVLWYAAHRPRLLPFIAIAAAAFAADGLLVIVQKPKSERPTAVPPQPTQAAQKVDPHGLCFVDFKVWHHDQKLAVTAYVANLNKDMVLVTLVGRDLSLDGFPVPSEPQVRESMPLYPEENPATFDSVVVSLGKEIPKGTVLHGRAYFLLRYGPSTSSTAVLKIKGRISIEVGTMKDGSDAAFWAADKDSTPDCPGVEKLIGHEWVSRPS
jgi:hypothetical protein